MGKNGGKRPGAGRKPKEVEENVKAYIRRAMEANGGEQALIDVWGVIVRKAKEGSEKHAQLLLSYYHGKPKENLEQPSELIIRVSHRD